MLLFRTSLVLGLFAACLNPVAAITITDVNVSFTEDFDTLASSGTGSVLPGDWAFVETGSSGDSLYAAGTGSSTSGNTYSFGASGATDRALGALSSGAVRTTFGSRIANQTGRVVSSFVIEYVGEQWRLGATGRQDRLDFSYSLDAGSLLTGAWLAVDELDFSSPKSTGTTGLLNGNAATNQHLLSYTLSGLTLPSGDGLWLRWSDIDITGADDGLAIDHFSIRATAVEPQNVSEHMPVAALGAVLGALCMAGSPAGRHLREIGRRGLQPPSAEIGIK